MNADMADRVSHTDREVLVTYIAEQRERGLKMLRSYPNSKLIIIKFEDMIKKPRLVAGKIARFLGLVIDIKLMTGVVVKRPVHCLPGMLEEEIYA